MLIHLFYGNEDMVIVIAYDVNTEDAAGKKRLRKVAKHCENYGVRVQNSVFECVVDAAQWKILKERIINEISQDRDSLRFYYLGNNTENKIEHFGAKTPIDVRKPLMF